MAWILGRECGKDETSDSYSCLCENSASYLGVASRKVGDYENNKERHTQFSYSQHLIIMTLN